MKIVRPPTDIARYTMVFHKRDSGNEINKDRSVYVVIGDNVLFLCLYVSVALHVFVICWQFVCVFPPPRMKLLGRTQQVWKKDGLNSCSYTTLSTERLPLYVNVTVDIGKPQSWDLKQEALLLPKKHFMAFYTLYYCAWVQNNYNSEHKT